MREISLEAVPNQAIRATLDGASWVITLQACPRHMAATIVRDNRVLVSGLRVVCGEPVIPYKYLSQHGNFALMTSGGCPIDWREFGDTQTLYFIPPDELPA